MADWCGRSKREKVCLCEAAYLAEFHQIFRTDRAATARGLYRSSLSEAFQGVDDTKDLRLAC